MSSCSQDLPLDSTRLLITTLFCLSFLKPSPRVRRAFVFFFFGPLTAHLHVSAFATYIVCILLHGLLKSSAQQQGHNHLLACVLTSTLKRRKWLLSPLDLFWKCFGFMTVEVHFLSPRKVTSTRHCRNIICRLYFCFIHTGITCNSTLPLPKMEPS